MISVDSEPCLQERSAAHAAVAELRAQLRSCSDSLESKQRAACLARSAAAAAEGARDAAALDAAAARKALHVAAEAAEAACQRRSARKHATCLLAHPGAARNTVNGDRAAVYCFGLASSGLAAEN